LSGWKDFNVGRTGKLDKVEAVLFDMDGVLVESSKAWFRTLNFILKQQGRPKVSWNVFVKHLGQNIERDVEVFFKGLKPEEVRLLYERHFPMFLDLVEPIPYAKEVLVTIRKSRIKTGCVTNTPKSLSIKILDKVGLLNYLQVVVGGDEVRHQKPEPEPIFKALSALKVRSNRTCFVGDTVYDIKAAERAGCIPIGFGVEYPIRIRSLKELIPLLGL